jgi:hypothetical protein
VQFSTFGKNRANGGSKASTPEKLHRCGSATEPPRLITLPALGNRPCEAILAAVKDPIGPALPSGILGVAPQNVAGGFEDSLRHGFAVLR